MTYPVDIVLVSWHRPQMTELVIRTLWNNTYRPHYRLIVVDNFSTASQRQMLSKLKDEGFIDELVLNGTNRGLEPARNQGLKLVKSKLFICADNDCLPEPWDGESDWLEKMVQLMDDYPEYAAISCRTQVMIGTGNIFEESDENEDEITDFPHPGGSLRIMRTSSVRVVEGWREDSPGRGSEERYICGKLLEHGWRTGFATNIRTLHLFGDRSQGTDRWGYPADWSPEASGHSDIYHPALTQGDDPEQIAIYAGDDYGQFYYTK